jgi:uncharacterized DUF497 family protein
LEEVFDGRFAVTRLDTRFSDGELRYNLLVEFKGRIINVTFAPRASKVHLISVRPASREERKVYHARRADRDNPATDAEDWANAFVGLPPLKTPVNAKFDVMSSNGSRRKAADIKRG